MFTNYIRVKITSHLGKNILAVMFFIFLASSFHVEAAALWDVGKCKHSTYPFVIQTCTITTFNSNKLKIQGESFTVELPGRPDVVISRRQLKADTKDDSIWVGTVGGRDDSSATFAVVNGRVFGDIVTSGGEIFRLRMDAKENRFFLDELDQKKLPKGKEPHGSRRNEPPKTIDESYRLKKDDCVNNKSLDILVLYTPAVLATVGNDPDQVRSRIKVAVAETETSYSLSGIPLTIDVKDVLQVQYTETGNVDDALVAVETDPNAKSMRKNAHADVVVLVTNDLGGGVANQLQRRHVGNLNFAESAYAVVSLISFTGGYAFGHELGHLFGAQHEIATYRGAFPFSKAFVHRQPIQGCIQVGWGTMMSQLSNCSNCKVLQFWSDPSGLKCSVSLGGLHADRKNAETLRRTLDTVTSFGCNLK